MIESPLSNSFFSDRWPDLAAPASFAPSVAAPASDGAALWFLFRGEQLVVAGRPEGAGLPPVLVDPAAAGTPSLRRQYLGHLLLVGNEAPLHCFSGELAEDAALPAGLTAVPLRAFLGAAPDTLANAAIRARQVTFWDRDHQFCGRCGGATVSMAAERGKSCPACGLTAYPRISPAMIIAVTRQGAQGEELLLARNSRFPAGFFSVVAGFVEVGESLEECCHREVQEETGIQICNVRYVGSQSWPFPHSLMVGFTAEYAGGELVPEAGEIAEVGWFTPETLPNLPPKLSIARRLIDEYVRRTRER